MGQAVGDEVGEDPVHGAAVGGEGEGPGHGQRDERLAVGRGQGREALDGRSADLGGLELLEAERPAAGLEVGQVAQLVDHALQPCGLLGDGPGRALGVGPDGGAVEERLGEAADDGQRRAQVVAQAGQQLALGAARVGDLGSSSC